MNKPKINTLAQHDPIALGPLLGQLRDLIVQARAQALRAVDTIQVQTCWKIGRYIRSLSSKASPAQRMAHGFGRNWRSA